jgi:UDP-glucose 4-epimerase
MSGSSSRTSLVTGGAGFIGSHLVERLLEEGHRVVAVDNFATGKRRDIAHLATNARFRLVEGDVADQQTMLDAMKGIDDVYHLAALADIVPSIEQPRPYHRANVEGTVNVLEAARDCGIQRFIYAASSSCYGIPDVYPTPETAPARPMYPYALTKYVAEQYVMHWAHTYGLPALSLRFFNVFGPRHRTSGTYGAVFGVFLAQKLGGKPLTIVGDGTQTRDFTFVTDVVDALVTAAKSDLVGEIMNVGSGNTYSVNRLAELIGGPTVPIPRRPGEPDCTFADISKIARLLDWHPKISLEEGVAILLENIDYWRDAPVWTPDRIEQATASWFKYLGNAPTAR